jgi:3alpha(or 20beta)-hydroxysteroid dehydrogenase
MTSQTPTLDGKVALISGGAKGQGEAEARLFVERGARVVIGDVLDDPGKAVADDLGDGAIYVHLDVTQPAAWRDAVSTATGTFGKLDVLVNNAGILRFAPLEATSLDVYMQVVNVNQVGCFLGMQAVVPAMREAGGGSIINTSSTNGLAGLAGTTAYSASKFAVTGMTKTAAIELGPHGIRVNSIHPGGVDTDMTRYVDGIGEVDPSKGYRWLPLGRVGQPEEVAELVAFLASDASSYCTGGEFLIDGGFLAGPTVPGRR